MYYHGKFINTDPFIPVYNHLHFAILTDHLTIEKKLLLSIDERFSVICLLYRIVSTEALVSMYVYLIDIDTQYFALFFSDQTIHF